LPESGNSHVVTALSRAAQTHLPTVDLEIVLANMIGGIIVFEPGGRIVYVNPAAEAMLGRSGRSITGESRESVLSEQAWLLELLGRVDDGGETSVRDEGLIGPGEGTEVLAVVSALRDATASYQGTLLALHDLSTRHRLQSDRVAHARVEEMDRMIATVAHELNNPLSGIRGAAQLLAKKLDTDADLGEYASMIVRQSDRMSDLIEALLGLSAVVSQMEPLNIHRVLNEVLLLERAASEERGIRLQPLFDPSLPEVEGNGAQLQQLFLNIIKNAISACPSGTGEVQVATRIETSFYVATGSRRQRYIAVEIRENGPGVDEETAEQMFTPFFSRSGEGHGLGLAIARNITMAHRGQIGADNIEGGGARFRVLLPVADTHNDEIT
jgi:two-component system nitrogen regulation sensor histidine kinase GlnL